MQAICYPIQHFFKEINFSKTYQLVTFHYSVCNIYVSICYEVKKKNIFDFVQKIPKSSKNHNFVYEVASISTDFNDSLFHIIIF